MRGDDLHGDAVFSYLFSEARVPQDHPLRPIRQMVDAVLTGLPPEFDRLYARTGRPSVPPEKLLRALLLQILHTIRSERLLIEQLDYNLLFRWFVGLNMDDRVGTPRRSARSGSGCCGAHQEPNGRLERLQCYLPPAEYCRGGPPACLAERRWELAMALEARKAYWDNHAQGRLEPSQN